MRAQQIPEVARATTTNTASDNAVFRVAAPTAADLVQFTLGTSSNPMGDDAEPELQIRVFAENGEATGDAIRTGTGHSNVVTVEPKPNRRCGSSRSANVAASTGLEGQINVTITPAATTDAIAYRIDSSKNGWDWRLEQPDTRYTRFRNNVYEDINLAPDATMYYRVFVIAADGSNVGVAEMNTTAGMTKASSDPSEVKNLKADGVSHNQIDLSWDEPDDTGLRPIDKYQIQRADPIAAGETSEGDPDTWADLACQVGSMTSYSRYGRPDGRHQEVLSGCRDQRDAPYGRYRRAKLYG